MPMMPAVAMPPMPIWRAYPLNSWSGVRSRPSVKFVSGMMTSHTSRLPQQMIKLYFRPMIYPRPSTAAPVLSFSITLALSARAWPKPTTVVVMVSPQAPKVAMIKSYRPPTRPAVSRVLAPAPPPSPLTSTCVVAVASGKGYLPCISLTKYFRNGMRNRMPSTPPSRDDRNICQKFTSTPNI